jgi:hypothetical protein
MADTWGPWLADRMPQAHKDEAARVEAREQREWEDKQQDAADRAAVSRMMAEHYESGVVYQYGHSSSELRQAAQNAAVAAEMRNRQSEFGSAERPAGLWTGADGTVHRFDPPELAGGRVVRPDSVEAQLARAREVKRSATVLGMVEELERRQQASGRTISRSASPETVECVECAAEGCTPEESFAVHYHPRFGDPLPPVVVPDYPPSRSKRVRSGVGWPMAVR